MGARTTSPGLAAERLAEPAAGAPLVLAGRFESIPLADVLQMLAASRASGILSIVRRATRERAEVELLEGHVVRAEFGQRGGQAGGLLGAVLLKERTVDAVRLGEALRVSENGRSTRPLASVLLEMEAVDPGVLAHAIAEQIELTLARVLRWEGGLFRFRSTPAVPSEAASELRVRLDPQRLLMSAARRADEEALVW